MTKYIYIDFFDDLQTISRISIKHRSIKTLPKNPQIHIKMDILYYELKIEPYLFFLSVCRWVQVPWTAKPICPMEQRIKLEPALAVAAFIVPFIVTVTISLDLGHFLRLEPMHLVRGVNTSNQPRTDVNQAFYD